jgi:hypothetical protein
MRRPSGRFGVTDYLIDAGIATKVLHARHGSAGGVALR